ncbi:MAG TPA: metallophosphoesterase [Parachlamydiaceae bacterium]|nr:metallophosphoesterase [Parachlamydiaceae bacterium]
MTVWALADLHFSFGVPDKNMDVFGNQWKDHPEKIRRNWLENIHEKDLVLLPGDISWAMRLEDARADLDWIHALPGTKVMIRGNHDYWWSSLKKIEEILPPSIHLIQNNVFTWNNIAIGGARMWDTPEYSFKNYVDYIENPRENNLTKVSDPKEMEKIFERELNRLEFSLKLMPKDSSTRIAMTHYPPIGAEMLPSRVSTLLKKYGISVCVFGHLHNIKANALPYGTKDGVRYILTSCDYLDFAPVKVMD